MHKLNGARMCCSSLLQPHTLGVGRVDAGGGREAYPVPTSTTQAGRRDAMSVASHNLSLCSRQTRAAVRWCGEGTTVSTTRMQHEEKSESSHPSISDHHCTSKLPQSLEVQWDLCVTHHNLHKKICKQARAWRGGGK
jgi:hypothetical protein